MKSTKKIAICIAAAAMMLFSQKVLPVQAANVEPCTISVVNSKAEMDNIAAAYTKKVSVDHDTTDNTYMSVTLDADSWVRFSGSYSMSENDGGQTHVNIYSDSAFSNKKGEYGWGYWEYTNSFCGFLPKGTYYLHINTKLGNYSKFEGNINIIAGAIPVSKIFTPVITTNSKKTEATVRLQNVLGSYADSAQYQPGSVGLSNCNDSKYWKWSIGGYWTGGNDSCVVLEEKDGYFEFKAKKNGYYTFLLEDYNENRYSVVIKVTSLDKTKPVIKGVKNNKTYKKAVKITFSDKGSGIKSAKLNGKKIKSGKKVSKKGSYTLVVTDKAGNSKKIKFKIK